MKLDKDQKTREWREFLDTDTGKDFMQYLNKHRDKLADEAERGVEGAAYQRRGFSRVKKFIDLAEAGKEGRAKQFASELVNKIRGGANQIVE